MTMNNMVAEVEAAICRARVPYGPHIDAYARLKERIDMAIDQNYSAGVAIIGDTGLGKSTLVDRAIREYQRTETEELSHIPLIYFQLTSEPSTNDILRGLLSEYGLRPKLRETKSSMRRMLETQIDACLTKIIVIDDAHHLMDRGKKIMAHKVSDDLKVIADMNVLLLLVGTPNLLSLFEFNRELRRRFSTRVSLNPLSRSKADAEMIRDTATSILKAAGCSLTIDDKKDDFWKRVHVATHGNIAYLNTLLAGAAAETLREDRKKIGLREFEIAFKQHIFYDADDATNPFHRKFDFRALNRPGEPFEDMEVPTK